MMTAKQLKVLEEKKRIADSIDEIKKLYEIEQLTLSEISTILKTNNYVLKEAMTNANITLRTWSETQKIMMNRPNVKVNISNASKKSQSKRKETNLKKYGSEVAANTFKWKDDYEKENGVRHPNQREESRENMRGDNNPAKLEENRIKIKQKRWDEKTQEELDEIMSKTKQTWIDNTGFDNPMKVQETKEKAKQTNLERRGVEWVPQDPNVKEKTRETHISRVIKKINEKLNEAELELIDDFVNITNLIEVKCKKCNYVFETVLDYVFHDYGKCPKCYPKNTSINEREIREFIESIIPDEEIIYNDRKILNGKEIDILVPSKKIAIEHNGIFWHSEKAGVTKDYHLDKTNSCKNQDYEMIHIFEDEWSYKKDLVKNKLTYKLNKDSLIYNSFEIVELDKNESKIFIKDNDLYELKEFDKSLGIKDNNEILALVSFDNLNGNVNIKNFCVKSEYSPKYISDIVQCIIDYGVKKITVETDKRFLDQELFSIFKIIDEKDPDYSYFKCLCRITKNELILQSQDVNLNESEYSELNGWFKIWDCGKYVLEYQKQTE
jgi:hypothetical protein